MIHLICDWCSRKTWLSDNDAMRTVYPNGWRVLHRDDGVRHFCSDACLDEFVTHCKEGT